jgi:glutathione reductase (NADPH)
LADSLFGPTPHDVDLSLVASAVFTLPPLATIGPTEADALAAGHKLKVFEADIWSMPTATACWLYTCSAQTRPRSCRAWPWR